MEDRESAQFVTRDRPEAVLAARRRPMAERVELSLAWDELVAELRDGLRAAKAKERAQQSRRD
jgi:hypothetical protein